jgi:hypothetical protein
VAIAVIIESKRITPSHAIAWGGRHQRSRFGAHSWVATIRPPSTNQRIYLEGRGRLTDLSPEAASAHFTLLRSV